MAKTVFRGVLMYLCWLRKEPGNLDTVYEMSGLVMTEAQFKVPTID